MKKINRIIAVSLALVIALASLASCDGTTSPIESSEDDLRTVMTVDTYEVPYELFRYFFMNFKKQFESTDEGIWTGADAAEKKAELDASVVGAIRGVYAVLSLCADYGIGKDDAKIKEGVQVAIDETVDSYGGEKAYVKALGENYMTDSVYRFLIAVDLCETELYNTMLDVGVIDNSDEAALANINGPDFIRTIQILIKNDAGDDIEENRKTAEELLERIKKGEDMDTLIGRYSEDLSMTPDGYYSTHLELIEEYEEAAYELELDEVSEVVETYVGFHIIKRLSKEADYIEKNFDTLKTQYLTSAFYRQIEDEKDKLNVTKNALYESFTVENME